MALGSDIGHAVGVPDAFNAALSSPMKENTPVPRLNKGISCQEKEDKTAVLSRVAKLRSVVALLHG